MKTFRHCSLGIFVNCLMSCCLHYSFTLQSMPPDVSQMLATFFVRALTTQLMTSRGPVSPRAPSTRSILQLVLQLVDATFPSPSHPVGVRGLEDPRSHLAQLSPPQAGPSPSSASLGVLPGS